MVSKARLDLPEPDRPVTTTRLSRGNSSETFLRLWTRAPCTAMVVRGAARFSRTGPALPGIGGPRRAEKCQLLDVHIAPFGQPRGQRDLGDQPLVGQVFAHT